MGDATNSPRKRLLPILVLIVFFGLVFNAAADAVTNLYSFGGLLVNPPDGAGPQTGLAKGFDGNFYGTTHFGGTSNEGAVFRINPDGSYLNLYSFGVSPNDGVTPNALVQGSDTNFYGTAYEGGANDDGAVFRISPDGRETILYSFAGYPKDGANPRGGIVQGYDGDFYGTAQYGGVNSYGIVFRISPDGGETNLYSFAGFPNDGALPLGGLMQGSDSNFYGTTFNGGVSNVGTVFRISPGGSYTNLYWFGSSPNDGQYPQIGLVEGSDGNFYGTTESGGTDGNGTVFRISPSGAYMSLYSFAGPFAKPPDGASPDGVLVEGSDTNFYGTTSYGGKYGYGTAFRISPGGSETNLHSFAGQSAAPPDGQYPQSGLVQASDGIFYGTTSSGGANNQGAVFVLDLNGGSGGGGVTNENCTFVLSATNATFATVGGAKNVRLLTKGTNCSWTAVSDDPFITITSGSSGTGNGTVNFSVRGNTNTTPLTGTMTIAGETFTVKQAAGGCVFMLNPKNGKFMAAGGSSTVKVASSLNDCDWTALSNNRFITIMAGASGVGNGTVHYTVATNTNTVALNGTMTIGGQTFTVNEAAATCKFSFGETNAGFSSTGGSSNVTVTANGTNCTWKAVASGAFIKIISGDSGTGDGTIDYTVEVNTKTVSRKGSISVDGEKLTITQSGAP